MEYITPISSPAIQGNYGPLASGPGVLNLNPLPTVSTNSGVVSTSKAAQENLTGIQTNAQNITNAANHQAQVNANNQASKTAQTTAANQANQAAQTSQNTANAITNATNALTTPSSSTGSSTVPPSTVPPSSILYTGSLVSDGRGGYTDPDGNPLTQNPNGTFSRIVTSPGQTNGAVSNPTVNPVSQPDYATQLNGLSQQEADAYNQFQTSMSQILAGTFPLTDDQQAQLNSAQELANQAMQMQIQANQRYEGGLQVIGLAQGGIAPSLAGSLFEASSQGAQKIATLNAQAAQSLAQLKQGFLDADAKSITDSYNALQTALTQRTTAIQDIQNAAQQAIENAQQQQEDYYTQVTKPIQDIAAEAAQNGALPSVIAQINAAKTPSDAISAAGDYLQTATGPLGDYLQYKRDTEAQGLTPLDYTSWTNQQNAQQIKQDSADAYAKAYATAQAQTDVANEAADSESESSDTVDSSDPDNQSILLQTGLSIPAFNYLVNGTSALTRLTATQRQQYMNEASDWANKNGIDLSTFQSQYKAYTDVVQQNIERANNTTIFANEITGTVNQFLADIGSNFGSLKASNVAALFAGKQVNDPTVQKYAFDLQTMQNDLAGYYAASRGSPSPDDSDKLAASEVIQNGINGKSAQAFQASIAANEQKVDGVVNDAVNSARQNIWSLFGVGDKFQPQVSTQVAKDSVDAYVKQNPSDAQAVSNLYAVPGTTDADVYEYLKQSGKIQ